MEGTVSVFSIAGLTLTPLGKVTVGDAKSATVFALDTGDTKGEPAKVQINVAGVNAKIAELLGAAVGEIQINDLAEVHGSPVLLGNQWVVRATRIDKRNEIGPVRVVGVAANLVNTSEAKTFQVGGLTVDYSAALLAGKVRPLCVFDSKVLDYSEKIVGDLGWNSIPTCKSQGLDIEYLMLRGIFMTPGATKDQVDYYVDLFQRVRKTDEWNKLMDEGAFNQTFMVGADYAKWVATEEKRHEDLMRAAGFLAQ